MACASATKLASALRGSLHPPNTGNCQRAQRVVSRAKLNAKQQKSDAEILTAELSVAAATLGMAGAATAQEPPAEVLASETLQESAVAVLEAIAEAVDEVSTAAVAAAAAPAAAEAAAEAPKKAVEVVAAAAAAAPAPEAVGKAASAVADKVADKAAEASAAITSAIEEAAEAMLEAEAAVQAAPDNSAVPAALEEAAAAVEKTALVAQEAGNTALDVAAAVNEAAVALKEAAVAVQEAAEERNVVAAVDEAASAMKDAALAAKQSSADVSVVNAIQDAASAIQGAAATVKGSIAAAEPAFKAGASLFGSAFAVQAGLSEVQKAIGADPETLSATSTNLGKQVVDFVTTTEPFELAEDAFCLVAAAYLLPPLVKAALAAARGYAGDVQPTAAMDALVWQVNNALVDIRSAKEKEVSGVADLPDGTKLVELEFVSVEDNKLYDQLRNANDVEVELTAVELAALKKLSKGMTLYILDPNGTVAKPVARELTKRGFSKVYVISGGAQAWTNAKLRTKPWSAAAALLPEAAASMESVNF